MRRGPFRAGIVLLALSLFLACGDGGRHSGEVQAAQAAALQLSSPAFRAGGEIPGKYTCEGEDVSPPLQWTAPPPGTESLALIADDPDAPGKTWVHWVAYDLPASLRGLKEAVPKEAEISEGGQQGRNDFGQLGYGGPCPPPGKTHHYHFKLYALSLKVGLSPGAGMQDLTEAIRGHVLSEAQLIGLFKR